MQLVVITCVLEALDRDLDDIELVDIRDEIDNEVVRRDLLL